MIRLYWMEILVGVYLGISETKKWLHLDDLYSRH